ncbi:hypothetical protein ACQP2X_39150 [Actinoplanes sp. CA-131856]
MSSLMAGADVMLIGLFSAKNKQADTKLDLLAASVETLGGRVVGRQVQRQGVSRDGARKMALPFSRRILLSSGKVREVAHACRSAGVTIAVFVNPLTEHQRTILSDLFGCPVVGSDDLNEHLA